eukprot:927947-Lingulodinium_polyedra.AAC.1
MQHRWRPPTANRPQRLPARWAAARTRRRPATLTARPTLWPRRQSARPGWPKPRTSACRRPSAP